MNINDGGNDFCPTNYRKVPWVKIIADTLLFVMIFIQFSYIGEHYMHNSTPAYNAVSAFLL